MLRAGHLWINPSHVAAISDEGTEIHVWVSGKEFKLKKEEAEDLLKWASTNITATSLRTVPSLPGSERS